MAEYHVSAGVFGGIYAGTLMPKKDGKPQMWRNKSDVTDEALCAVRDHLYSEFIKDGKTQGGYEWTRKDGKVVSLLVKVEDKQDGERGIVGADFSNDGAGLWKDMYDEENGGGETVQTLY